MATSSVTLVVERTQSARITATYDTEQYDQWRGQAADTPAKLQEFLEAGRNADVDLERWATGTPESAWSNSYIEIDRVASDPVPAHS